MMRKAMNAGFTLIELLVTLLLLGLLTAVVFPIVVQQIDDAEPTKIANDLVNIRTGVELFQLNVRPRNPGDLEDLVHQVETTEDADITGTAFGANNANAWKGPYIDATIPEDTDATVDQQTGNAIVTGFDLDIQNDIVCFDAVNNVDDGTTCTEGEDFIALKILGATIDVTAGVGSEGSEFAAIDGLLDNTDGVAGGKIRALDGASPGADGDETIYYLVGPYTD